MKATPQPLPTQLATARTNTAVAKPAILATLFTLLCLLATTTTFAQTLDAEAYLKRGGEYYKKNDYDRAISDWTQAVRLKPDYAEAYLLRGLAYDGKGDYDRAISDYEFCLRIEPNDFYLKLLLALARNKQSSGGDMFTDSRDGKKYRVVKIGEQIWFAENLKYNASDSKCYDNNPGYCTIYGRLYSWETAKKACPSGWHLPSRGEYETLDKSVDEGLLGGTELKAKIGWEGKGNGTDNYGFSALPGGFGSSDDGFAFVGEGGFWWKAGESEYDSNYAYSRRISYSDGNAGVIDSHSNKSILYSVRCVRD